MVTVLARGRRVCHAGEWTEGWDSCTVLRLTIRLPKPGRQPRPPGVPSPASA